MDRLIKLVKKLLPILFNRETIHYAIAGILTTIVNFASYHLFCNILKVPNLISNIIAWMLAVTFAYIINKTLVFLSKSSNRKEEVQKVTKFFGARLISLGVEEFGLYIFVDRLNVPNLQVKAALALIVIILNYIFSKQCIFNKPR